MRVVGIVAEYNPFHSGHAYHLAQAKALTHSDFALVVMSGDFVQRGEPAMFSKHLRAKWALSQGADLVVSLPTVCSLTSAAGFARGAITLLDGLQVVDSLCFGSELGDVSLLQQALAAADTPAHAQALTASLKQGGSYPAARDAALRAAQGFAPGPNDILGLEYLRALSLCQSAIAPYALRREGAGHDQDGLFGPHASATALRGCIQAGDLESLAPYLSPQVRSDMAEQLAQGDPGMAWNGPRSWYRTDGKGNCIMTGKSGVEMEFRTEGYQMANGETATIVTARALHGAEEYIGYFVHEGVLYEVQPVALAEEINVVPDFRTLTQRILDSFA